MALSNMLFSQLQPNSDPTNPSDSSGIPGPLRTGLPGSHDMSKRVPPSCHHLCTRYRWIRANDYNLTRIRLSRGHFLSPATGAPRPNACRTCRTLRPARVATIATFDAAFDAIAPAEFRDKYHLRIDPAGRNAQSRRRVPRTSMSRRS